MLVAALLMATLLQWATAATDAASKREQLFSLFLSSHLRLTANATLLPPLYNAGPFDGLPAVFGVFITLGLALMVLGLLWDRKQRAE